MEQKAIGAIVAVVIVASVIVGVILFMSPSGGLINRGPILIDSNDDFTLFASSGNGTESDPYIIEDFRIVLPDGPDSACIHVVDTTSYFIIRNCEVTSLYGESGIALNDVSNGIVMSCNVSNGMLGIVVYECDNIAILNNIIEGFDTGLAAVRTTNFVESGNTFIDCDTEIDITSTLLSSFIAIELRVKMEEISS